MYEEKRKVNFFLQSRSLEGEKLVIVTFIIIKKRRKSSNRKKRRCGIGLNFFPGSVFIIMMEDDIYVLIESLNIYIYLSSFDPRPSPFHSRGGTKGTKAEKKLS